MKSRKKNHSVCFRAAGRPCNRCNFGSQRGVALVIALLAMVLLTALVLAFFSKAILNRQISYTSATMLKAERLSRSSLDVIKGELRQEIADPALSLVLDGGNTNYPAIYRPRSGANAVPRKLGISGEDANGSVTLAKVSGANIPIRESGGILGSDVSIGDVSLNGRYYSLDRWFGSGGPKLGSQSVLPTWLYFTRNNGVKTPSIGNARDSSSDDYVGGRFAYTVYDVSGLVDANVAGSPSATPFVTDPLDRAFKTSLAYADLTRIGFTTANVDNLVLWRNRSTALDQNTFREWATGQSRTTGSPDGKALRVAGTGHLCVAAGDNTFLSRRELLRAATLNKAGITASAVPSLTIFSRENTQPSWSPTTASGSTVDYAANADSDTSANRFVANVRFTAAATITGYKNDGTPYTYQVSAGDPLVQRRFPLERLQWIGSGGPQNGGTVENIQACFGLKWLPSTDPSTIGANVWQYVGPSGSTVLSSIKTLKEVVDEPTKREPNFFELLKAGILSNSLAVDSSSGSGSGPAALSQRSSVLQILRIGACILDQNDTDSYPTVIEYNQSGAAWQAVGVESLPYINVMKTVTGESTTSSPVPPQTSAIAAYSLFGLWNPNKTPTPVAAPPQLRLRVKGAVLVLNSFGTNFYPWVNGPTIYGIGYTTVLDTTIRLSDTAGKGSRGFTNPGLLTPADVSGTLTDPGAAGSAWTTTPVAMTSLAKVSPGTVYVGYRLPDFKLNANYGVSAGWQSGAYYGYVVVGYGVGARPFSYSMEFQTPEGKWIPYSFSQGNNDPATWILGAQTWQTHFYSPPHAGTIDPLAQYFVKFPLYMTPDPRTTRIGLFQYTRNFSTPPERAPDALTTSLWPTGAEVTGSPYQTTYANYGYGAGGAGFAPSPDTSAPALLGSGFYYPAQLCRNNKPNTAPNSSYKDRDGLMRIGDSGLYTGGNSEGNPYQNPADRPVILNRPFRNVGELGYVFRDAPWKSLDLFSANSAEAGLLDLFCVGQNADTSVVAGKISLNTRSADTLASVLSGTVPDVMNSASSMVNMNSMANSIVTSTKAAPILNKQQLVTQVGPSLTSTSFANTSEQNIKARREAYIRSLCDVGQTRTWNLLIDVVAQTGKFPASAKTLKDFLVEGERRYWLHIAIDRYTGAIISEKLEPVLQ